MKNKIVSLLAIIFGIMIIAFPMIGIISSGAILGLSVLLISIFTLMTGLMIIDYNTSGAIIDIILSMILLFISIGIIFNPTLIGFLTEISLYLGGIILIIGGVVSLINNRTSKNGFYIGIAGIILGVIYIIVGTYVANPIILGTLIGIWLVISGVMRLIY
ncbi:DUF308 domain-containing protein [Methanobrevibacter millerae]|jgi:uncharacterized membrane protein HdeD (DUF308 family)|uniref:DUF308 domain-containing protein n=1 Tax=Methanobrevibacter millerae TaxID=230361 RepID=A0A0U3CEG8_9EURY|nr:DUF308 domain-containing protein [Methanobrevibacter millerae]ALT68219.1 hypothetical protein sm9_0417 [Methanobrevibacter millerae]MBO6109451.1 DUF308 domain-containing protein [Methanobrevibacter sp.]MBO6275592.1 DUF308 domain-containing protein [Methanobrevibacter sp.]MBP3226063.1 DUF308 domain-containing protein [Methanobrevibacter sp.]